MKVLRETTDFQLNEKLELFNNLKMYIDKQEDKIHEIQEERGEEILFNVSNSVSMFVNQISQLQDRLIIMQEERCQLQAKHDEANTKIASLEESIKTDFISKVDYDLLMKEKDILSRTPKSVVSVKLFLFASIGVMPIAYQLYMVPISF